MNIVIAYDGSEFADAALDDLSRAGLPLKASARIVCAADVWIPPGGLSGVETDQDLPASIRKARKTALEGLEHAQALANKAAQRVAQLMPAWEIKTDVIADSPAWAVIKLIESWPTDLAVLGARGQSRLQRLLLGSVSQKVLAEAQCSVRIGRRTSSKADGPVRIMLGLDGSIDSRAMVEIVASRNWPRDSEARLVTAIDPSIESATAFTPESLKGWVQDEDEDVTSWVTRMMIDEGQRLERAGLQVSTKVKFDDPRDAMIEEAAKWNAETIFVGARGHRIFDRFLLGSVSSSLAARAACSVEVVRAAAQG